MSKDPPIPFKEGDSVETKSFLKGYRGAWFRCKIVEISDGKNRSGHVLHYIDFPEEKKKWVASYQVPPYPAGGSKRKRERVRGQKKEIKTETELVLRPPYPPIHRKDEVIPPSARSTTRVVIEGHWCVGDLVDMLRDGVYWCGKVTQVLNKEETMVELLPPPMGEGDLYKASMADLRPTLIWSLQSGWTVPIPEGVAEFHQRVQILYPEKQTADSDLPTSEEHIHCETVTEVVAGDAPGTTKTLEVVADDAPGTTKTLEMVADDAPGTTKTLEDVDIPLLSASMDTIEAAIIDLEELGNKLSWLKQILKDGYPIPDDASSTSRDHRS